MVCRFQFRKWSHVYEPVLFWNMQSSFHVCQALVILDHQADELSGRYEKCEREKEMQTYIRAASVFA